MFTTQQVKDILDDLRIEYRSYSGRAMYGKCCLGVVIEDSLLGTVADIMASIDDPDDREEMATLFHRAKQDSLGRSAIVYFPCLAWDEEPLCFWIAS